MTELYVLGGALVAAGAYIMYLHKEIRLYQQDVKILGFVLSQIEEALKEEANDTED